MLKRTRHTPLSIVVVVYIIIISETCYESFFGYTFKSINRVENERKKKQEEEKTQTPDGRAEKRYAAATTATAFRFHRAPTAAVRFSMIIKQLYSLGFFFSSPSVSSYKKNVEGSRRDCCVRLPG